MNTPAARSSRSFRCAIRAAIPCFKIAPSSAVRRSPSFKVAILACHSSPGPGYSVPLIAASNLRQTHPHARQPPRPPHPLVHARHYFRVLALCASVIFPRRAPFAVALLLPFRRSPAFCSAAVAIAKAELVVCPFALIFLTASSRIFGMPSDLHERPHELGRNLLSKDRCRPALGDETVKSGPEVSFVGMTLSLACDRKRLTWT